MKFLYGFWFGIMMAGIWAFMLKFESYQPDPEFALSAMASLFIVGFIIGWIAGGKIQRKKEEEELRQYEQDRNAELMRKYLEKKLREEKEDK